MTQAESANNSSGIDLTSQSNLIKPSSTIAPETLLSAINLLQDKLSQMEKLVNENTQLATKITNLEQQLAASVNVKSITKPFSPSQNIPRQTVANSPIFRQSSRRRLLKRLGFTAASLAVASAAALNLEAIPTSQAASGDFTLLGNSNLASDTTYLSQTGNVNLASKAVLWADWNPVGQSSTPPVNAAIAGTTPSPSNTTNLGIGGYFQGNLAPILLAQDTTRSGAPSGSGHSAGELYVDSSGTSIIVKWGEPAAVGLSLTTSTPFPLNKVLPSLLLLRLMTAFFVLTGL